jgi:hypothetical protein
MGDTEEARAATRDRVFPVVDDGPERGVALR